MRFGTVKYLLIGVLGLGFFVRFLLLVRSPDFDATRLQEGDLPAEIAYFRGQPCHDSQEYKALAINMIKHGRFSWNSKPVTLRTPGYPAFIAAVYSVFGMREWVVMLFQVLLSTASIYLIYLIGRDAWNKWTGMVAGLLFSVDLASIFYSSLFLSDTLFLFFVLTGSWLLLRQRSVWSGLIFGISALVRPVGFYIFIPALFFHRSLRRGVLFAIFFLLPIAPWLIRNFNVYRVPSLTSVQGYNLLFCNVAAFESQEQGADLRDVRRELSKGLDSLSANPLHLSSQAQGIAVGKITSSPWKYSLFHVVGAINLFLSIRADDVVLRLRGAPATRRDLLDLLKTRTSPGLRMGVFALAGLEMAVVICSIVFAAIGLIRSPRWPGSFLLVLVVYFFILSGGGFIEGRLRLPMMPYLYLLASNFLVYSKKKG